MAKDQEILKPKYGFASLYSKEGAVEGRSIVMSGKDLKKEMVCRRIFELAQACCSVKSRREEWHVALKSYFGDDPGGASWLPTGQLWMKKDRRLNNFLKHLSTLGAGDKSQLLGEV
ncbi:hypothetical protein QOT17_002100 [Balamuthia mandrillaris]